MGRNTEGYKILMSGSYSKKFFQDGPDFYDSETGKRIVSYPQLVKNDYDIEGAIHAESVFRDEHPAYTEKEGP